MIRQVHGLDGVIFAIKIMTVKLSFLTQVILGHRIILNGN